MSLVIWKWVTKEYNKILCNKIFKNMICEEMKKIENVNKSCEQMDEHTLFS